MRCLCSPAKLNFSSSLIWQTFPQGIRVENFTSCWADGTTFCALIHNFFPNAFDFKSINKSNRKQNYDIAFKAGE